MKNQLRLRFNLNGFYYVVIELYMINTVELVQILDVVIVEVG